MVQLVDSDIKTREVLGWKGVHVLHFAGSSCSQKLRIFLNLKGMPWESHPIDLPGNENMQPWFLGINPRGLVPVLVHDGAVQIESNDIIQYLEERFPAPRLIPAGHENEVAALLKHEDDLHLDLRTLERFPFRLTRTSRKTTAESALDSMLVAFPIGKPVSTFPGNALRQFRRMKSMTTVAGGQVGRSLPRLEAGDKVTGRAEYTHTMRLPGMLHGKIFRSTVAHGRIKSIDMSAAKRIPGVYRVVTADDVRKVMDLSQQRDKFCHGDKSMEKNFNLSIETAGVDRAVQELEGKLKPESFDEP